jgi:glycosyltransferase involved in cell wall biosynthesis
VILRGHQVNPWELRPWEQDVITRRFDVSYLASRRGWFDTGSLQLDHRRILTMRDLLPKGALGDLAVRAPGDRYLGLPAKLRTADSVHTQELGYWYSMQAARLRSRLGFKLVTTVWETIPFLDSYRNVRTRAYRRQTLAATDLFLAATERARTALLLEGVPAERIRVSPPGVATDRFGTPGTVGERVVPAGPPLILSPGRLVWEKGHQDVLRAVALLRRGLREGTHIAAKDVRLQIVGTGPEERRLRAYAAELGIADAVEFRGFIAYDEMPAVYAGATCVVLASLPVWSWEEQFGMVLAEAMAGGTPVIASTSGAIDEVTGDGAGHFGPGDWPALAGMLDALITDPEDSRHAAAAQERVRLYSTAAAAERLASAYNSLLGDRSG